MTSLFFFSRFSLNFPFLFVGSLKNFLSPYDRDLLYKVSMPEKMLYYGEIGSYFVLDRFPIRKVQEMEMTRYLIRGALVDHYTSFRIFDNDLSEITIHSNPSFLGKFELEYFLDKIFGLNNYPRNYHCLRRGITIISTSPTALFDRYTVLRNTRYPFLLQLVSTQNSQHTTLVFLGHKPNICSYWTWVQQKDSGTKTEMLKSHENFCFKDVSPKTNHLNGVFCSPRYDLVFGQLHPVGQIRTNKFYWESEFLKNCTSFASTPSWLMKANNW